MEREAGALPSELEPGSAACRVTLGQAGSLLEPVPELGSGGDSPLAGPRGGVRESRCRKRCVPFIRPPSPLPLLPSYHLLLISHLL